MKLTVLMENTACCPGIAAEHGLSIYVQTQGHTFLFDAGPNEAFADNAAALGVDLSQVDVAFLSHGHWDHSGGLLRFLQENQQANVYVSDTALGQYYRGELAYIGVDQSLANHPRVIQALAHLKIDDALTLCRFENRTLPYPIDSAGLTERRGQQFIADTFGHEQYLLVEDQGRKILFSGCSHKGILNIMDWLKPDILIGGFHFMKEDVSTGSNPRLDHAAETLLAYNTTYYTCHCTGEDQFDYLKQRMGQRLHRIRAGQVLEI